MYKVTYTYYYNSCIGLETRSEWKLYDEQKAGELQKKIENRLNELRQIYDRVSFKIERI